MNRYHETVSCDLDKNSISEAIDKALKNIAGKVGHEVRIVNVAFCPVWKTVIVTVIAEDK